MKYRGKAIVVGDNVNTDEIIPAKYLVTTDPAELGEHCLEGMDPGMPARINEGDILIGGKNFGCGSSREHAPVAIKGKGIPCVIAAGFARIFYRNSINVGLPIFECPDAAKDAEAGDEIEVDPSKGKIENITKGKSYTIQALPPFIQEIIEAGGLMNYIRKRRMTNVPRDKARDRQ